MPSADDKIAAGAPPAAAATARRPIGVPPDYVALPPDFSFGVLQPQHQEEMMARVRTPSFFDGDEYRPATWSAEDKARLQLAMRNAGLIGERQRVSLGTWDDVTAGAFRKLLEYANSVGHVDPLEALRDFAENKAAAEAAGLSAGELEEPLLIRRTNPADLRRAADDIAPTVIGRRLKASEIDRLVAAYQSLQEQEQRAAAAGGVVTEAPSFQAFAEAEARAIDPRAAERQVNLDVGNEFFSLLGGAGIGDPAPTKTKVKASGGLSADFERRLNALIAASEGRLRLRSGYRSVEEQSALWNAAVAKYGSAKAARKWVAPPGHSNHNRGEAADLAGDLQWAHANAARFGLHFPMGHEPWHAERVDLKGGSKQAHTDPPDSPTVDPVEEERHTLGYQLGSLASILLGGDNDTEVAETV